MQALRAAAAILMLPCLAMGQETDSPARQYLALGDSFTFAYITGAGFEYVNPDNFFGFPNYVSLSTKLNLNNASCPGETAGSFLSATAPDNGCRSFRAVAPLHVHYPSIQLDYATAFLLAHPAAKLVTISLGANDVKLLQQACLGNVPCIYAGLQQTLAQVAINLKTIIGDLRTTGFKGKIVVVNYYSTDYTDPNITAITFALDQALAAAASQEGALVADLFTAFQIAAVPAGGHTCRAGLLNALPQNQFLCDDHPSQSGHMLAAKTIARTLDAAKEDER
jgi:lysophospholipase L1-like esterase